MPDAAAIQSIATGCEQQRHSSTETNAAGQREKLPPKIYGIMAATTFATWGTLAGSYQLLF